MKNAAIKNLILVCQIFKRHNSMWRILRVYMAVATMQVQRKTSFPMRTLYLQWHYLSCCSCESRVGSKHAGILLQIRIIVNRHSRYLFEHIEQDIHLFALLAENCTHTLQCRKTKVSRHGLVVRCIVYLGNTKIRGNFLMALLNVAPTVIHWSTLLSRKSKRLSTLMPTWLQVATMATKSLSDIQQMSVIINHEKRGTSSYFKKLRGSYKTL